MLQIICRTCLAMDGEFSSIYESKALCGSNSVADMLGDLTSHTPKKFDGLPEMVCLSCMSEINRCYFFKMRCLNSESMLMQFLESCEESKHTTTDTDTVFEKNRECILPQEQVAIADVDFVKADEEAYVVIDLKDDSERSEIQHEVEKHLQLHYINEDNGNVAENKQNAEARECILPQVETPDVEFVENDEESCIVIDSEEESESLQIEKEQLDFPYINEEHGNVANADVPIENNQNDEARERTPDVEFVETAMESYVVIDSDEESLNSEIKPHVGKHLELRCTNQDELPIENNRNGDSSECIFPQKQVDISDGDFVKTEEEPYVVIDLECENERLEIKHEVEKHMKLLYSDEENISPVNADVGIAEGTECILPQVDATDLRFVGTDEDSYIVIDSDEESERLEIEHVDNAEIRNTQTVESRSCILPQLDVEFVDSMKESYIVLDSDEESVAFVIEHDVEEHQEENDPANAIRQTKHNEISEDFRNIFDSFNAGGGEGVSNQYGPVDNENPPGKLQCPQCTMTFLDPTNLSQHMMYCEIVRQDKCTKEQCTSPTYQFIISRGSVNVDRDNASGRNETSTFKEQLSETNVNSSKKPHRCPICQEGFSHKSLLTYHMRLHLGGSPFYCFICDRGFSSKSSLKEHTMRHSHNRSIKCEECLKSFYSMKELYLHKRIHTGDSPYLCDLCKPPSSISDNDTNCAKTDKSSDQKENEGVRVKDEADVDMSTDIVAEKGPSSSSTQEKGLPFVAPTTDNEEHKNARQRRQMYMQAHRCTNCGAGFFKEKSLEFHVNQFQCNSKPFFCSNSKCQNSISLSSRTRRVSTTTCDICNLVFANNNDRFQHDLENHTVGNQCPICKQIARSARILKDHMRVHNDRPFVCLICDNAFIRSGCLTQHILRRHKKTRPFKCGNCPRSFINNRDLALHFRTHTGERPYACQLCPKRYTTYAGLRSHRQRRCAISIGASKTARSKSCDDATG